MTALPRMSHGMRRLVKCLKGELTKLVRKQVRQLKERSERLKGMSEKLESSIDDKNALTRAASKLKRQIVNGEKRLEAMKSLDIVSKAEDMWNEVERRVHKRKRTIEKEKEEDAMKLEILEKLEYSDEVRMVRDAVEQQLQENVKKKRRIEKSKKKKEKSGEKKQQPQEENKSQKRPRKQEESELGKRALKRQARALEWRRKQAERLQSESKSYRKARSRVSESVFLGSLSDAVPIKNNNKIIKPYRRNEEETTRIKQREEKKKSYKKQPKRNAAVTEKKKKQVDLHPSWAAKKKQSSAIVSFKGTRVTFDD